MKHFFFSSVVVGVLSIVACSGDGASAPSSSSTSSGAASSSSGASSSSSGESSTSSSGASTSSSGGSSSGDVPAASTKEVDIQFNAACAAFTPCGNTPSGTYDYTAGCVGDVFAQARANCDALDTSKAKATVKGSIYFLAGGALKRDVTVRVSGTLTFPNSCVFGQCALAETGLKTQFPNATCAANGANCDCTIDRTETNTAATTFTVVGNTINTADGDTYEHCVAGTSFKYKGNSAGAEGGTWELMRR